MPLAFPKKSGYKTKRELKRTQYRELRPEVREAAWLDADQRCLWPTCRRALVLESDNVFVLVHAHELVKRSQLGDATDVDNVVCLCWKCHHDLHMKIGGKTKRIDGHSVSAGLRFFERTREGWQEVPAA